MAYQTSCATIVHGSGIHCETDIVADAEGRELVQHGSALFPIACYAEDLTSYSVAWHWHEEFEYILAMRGPLQVDVNKTRLTLQTGQGVFLNSGALHSVEQAEHTALLHSGVFQPRLVGGMDTIFWQKLIRRCCSPVPRPFSCWTRPCRGKSRCWPVCGMRGKRWPMSLLTTRTGCGIISRRRCGC